MHPQIKQSWVQALRGGEFQQGFGALRTQLFDGPRHCAMGVLMELVARHKEWPAHEMYPSFGAGFSSPVLKAIGVSKVQASLIAQLNDRGASFSEIADVIERDIESEDDLAVAVSQQLQRISASSKAFVPMSTFLANESVSNHMFTSTWSGSATSVPNGLVCSGILPATVA